MADTTRFQDPERLSTAELIKAARVAQRIRELVGQWRTDPGAFPDGAADVLEQISAVLAGDGDG